MCTVNAHFYPLSNELFINRSTFLNTHHLKLLSCTVIPILPIPVFGEKDNKNNKKIPPPSTLQHFIFIHSLALIYRGFGVVEGYVQQSSTTFNTFHTLFILCEILLNTPFNNSSPYVSTLTSLLLNMLNVLKGGEVYLTVLMNKS
jgi:hypothetical protein